MLAIGMPGPFEWVVILVLLGIPVLALMLGFRIWRYTGRRNDERK
jgi:hypothetical protein